MSRPVMNNKAMKMWNLYVDEQDKAEYFLALAKNGKSRCQSAGIRALMYLYVTDNDIQEKVNKIIDKYLVINASGRPSKN